MSIHTLGTGQGASAMSLLCEAVGDLERARQRRHELWILTCYINLKHLTALVVELLACVRITDVYLAFDMSEVFRLGQHEARRQLGELASWCRQQDIKFEYKALSAPALVHAKGYAVLQRVNDHVDDGVVLVTSANLTQAGFFNERNVELGYLSRLKRDLRSFEDAYNQLWDDYGRSVEISAIATSPGLFPHALLSSGVFLHKWDGSLSQMVGMKYRLTEEAKQRSTLAQELADLGLEPGDTATQQALTLDSVPGKAFPAKFIKNFTVETYCGRWCPMEAWEEALRHLPEIKEFATRFRTATTDEILDECVLVAARRQSILVERQLIKPLPESFNENWRQRLVALRANSSKLDRLFTGYEKFDLPYDASNQEAIHNLYESLLESVSLSRRRNVVMKKLLAADESRNLAELLLKPAERDDIARAMRDRSAAED